ncbi:MAG: ArsR/SmtB family transcription factor [Candidatus Hodarchaeota archaeon]
MELQEYGTYPEHDDLKHAMRYTEFGEQLEVLKALASETRLKIIRHLRECRDDPERGLDISSLAKILEQTEANISAQCKRLEKVGLIKIVYKPGGHGVRKICQVDFGLIEFLFD